MTVVDGLVGTQEDARVFLAACLGIQAGSKGFTRYRITSSLLKISEVVARLSYSKSRTS